MFCFEASKFKVPKFQNMNSGSLRCVGQTFPTFSKFQNLKLPQIISFKHGSSFSWILWSVLVSPKINNIGVGAQGHVRKPRNHRNEEFEGSHTSKSRSYKFKLKQNNTTEFLSTSFPTKYHTSYPEINTNTEIAKTQQNTIQFTRQSQTNVFFWVLLGCPKAARLNLFPTTCREQVPDDLFRH